MVDTGANTAGLSRSDETPRKGSTASDASSPTAASSGKKALPLLPFMSEEQASNVEMLLTKEKNLVTQHRNIGRMIAGLEKVEHASLLEVSFAAVLRIARARRREDCGEGSVE